ncbi:pirin family protein [Rhodoferax aquaticus]|uniref:Pirin family protein n=1 Tax=Rhodoferax aquaticus TaxID=2527691 RepID=A0A515EJT8_9BURK|nr:pirin family protein [Rhodoferax aquaticus]QDL52932.1 pirin family protein [Rhodoferax aquaticus]
MTFSSTTERRIVHRTRGSSHGPITRLVSPGDVGELIKPFIFLDRFEAPAGGPKPQFGMHPHSGIATLTYLIDGRAQYEDTTGEHGARGVLPTGGVEWMMAGGGVWHRGGPADQGRVLGFQLWVAMPPALELASAYSQYLDPQDIPHAGPARVLLGSYGGHTSPIAAPSNMGYLGVHLSAGESWTYTPPAGHTVAWLAVGEGHLSAPSPLSTGDLAVFEEGNASITLTAQTDTVLVFGTGEPHPHDLHMGPYSVHTSPQSLHLGQSGIRDRANTLKAQGRL